MMHFQTFTQVVIFQEVIVSEVFNKGFRETGKHGEIE
jgi:hypothetical protein